MKPLWLRKLVTVGFPALLGLFMVTLTVGVLAIGGRGPPTLVGWLVRVAVGAILGGCGTWLLYMAALESGLPWPRRAPPRALLARCPGCGLASEERPCPLCGHATERAAGWRPVAAPGGVGLLNASLGVGALALGVLLGLAPLYDPDARPWALVVVVAFALLLAGAGVLFLVGAGLAARDAWRARGAWVYRDALDEDEHFARVDAKATVTRSRLVAEGRLREERPLATGKVVRPVLPTLPPTERAFVTAMALLHEAGRVELVRRRVIEWRVDSAADRGAVTRIVESFLEARRGEQAPKRDLLLPARAEGRPVAAIWAEVQADEALRARLPHGARVDASDPVVQALAAEVAAQVVH